MEAKEYITFEAFVGDNKFEGGAYVTPGRPMIGPDLNGPGEPEEGPEVEIDSVKLCDPEGELPSIEIDLSFFWQQRRKTMPIGSKDGKPRGYMPDIAYDSVMEILEEAAIDAYRDQRF